MTYEIISLLRKSLISISEAICCYEEASRLYEGGGPPHAALEHLWAAGKALGFYVQHENRTLEGKTDEQDS